MQPMSSAGSFLDGLLGINMESVVDARSGIGGVLNNGTIASASQPLESAAGKHLLAQLSRPGTVSYTEPTGAANDAAVGALKAHYERQFREGGLAGQAALQQAQLAGDLQSRGGAAGIRQDMLATVARQQAVAQASQAERGAGADAANALQASDANAALKRAVLAAQVSQANFENAYNARAATFGLVNTQEQLRNQAQEAIQGAEYQRSQLDLQQRQQQAELGKALLGMITNAAAGGISTGLAQSAASAPSAITAGQLPSASPAQPLGNYMLPGIQAGADTAARTYQPIFNTPSAVPNTANYWST